MRLTELSSVFGFETDLADLVLRPPVQAFGAMDFRRSLGGLEELGYRYARAEIARWLASDDAPAVLRAEVSGVGALGRPAQASAAGMRAEGSR